MNGMELEFMFHFLMNNNLEIETKKVDDITFCRAFNIKTNKPVTPWLSTSDAMKAAKRALEVYIRKIDVSFCLCGERVKVKKSVLRKRGVTRIVGKCKNCEMKHTVLV